MAHRVYYFLLDTRNVSRVEIYKDPREGATWPAGYWVNMLASKVPLTASSSAIDMKERMREEFPHPLYVKTLIKLWQLPSSGIHESYEIWRFSSSVWLAVPLANKTKKWKIESNSRFEPLIIFSQLPKIAEDFRNSPRKCSRWFDYALIWYLLTVLLVACEWALSCEFGSSGVRSRLAGGCTVKISPEQEQVSLPIGYAIGTELFLPEVMKLYLPKHWIRCMWFWVQVRIEVLFLQLLKADITKIFFFNKLATSSPQSTHYKSLDELRFICRAFLTFCKCSLILLACLVSHWFSFVESPLEGCFAGEGDLLRDSSVVGYPFTGVLK